MFHARCACAALLSSAAAAQTVWTVAPAAGPGVHYTALQAAIDAAASGDVVLLRPGSYASAASNFVIASKSLVLCADGTGPITFADASTGQIRDLNAAQSVRVRGLASSGSGFRLVATQCAGPVWIEACELKSSSFKPGLEVQGCANVVVEGSAITGGSANGSIWSPPYGALDLRSSTVSLHDCTLQGFNGSSGFGGLGGLGCTGLTGGTSSARVALASTLFGSNLTGQGGNGGACYYSQGCTPYSTGYGLELESGSAAYLLASTFNSGSGVCPTTNPPDIVGLAGSAASGSLQVLAGAARHFNTVSPLHAGDTATLTLSGVVGDFAFAGVSADAGGALLVPWYGPLALGGAVTVLALGVVDASGSAHKAIALPLNLAAGTALVSHFQGAVLDAQIALRLAPPTLLVTLASGL
jgi:hypothetical protein